MQSNGQSVSISYAGYVSATLCLFDNQLLSGNSVCPYNPNGSTEAFIPDAIAVSAISGTIYVTDEGGANVSVINDTTNHITSSVKVGLAPADEALDERGSHLYVANWGSDTLTVVDTRTSATVATIPVGVHPAGVVYDGKNGHVYVANQYSANVSVIDGTTFTSLGNISGVGAYPSMATYDFANGYIYQVVQNGITVINASSQTVVTEMSIPAVGYAGSDFYDPLNGDLYVSSYSGPNVTLVNTTTNTIAGTIDSRADHEFGFALNTMTGLLYEAMTSRNVSVFYATANTFLGSFDYGSTSPDAIAYVANNGLIYVANGGWDTITIITPGPSPSQSSGGFPYVLFLVAAATGALAVAFVWYAARRRRSAQFHLQHQETYDDGT